MVSPEEDGIHIRLSPDMLAAMAEQGVAILIMRADAVRVVRPDDE